MLVPILAGLQTHREGRGGGGHREERIIFHVGAEKLERQFSGSPEVSTQFRGYRAYFPRGQSVHGVPEPRPESTRARETTGVLLWVDY